MEGWGAGYAAGLSMCNPQPVSSDPTVNAVGGVVVLVILVALVVGCIWGAVWMWRDDQKWKREMGGR